MSSKRLRVVTDDAPPQKAAPMSVTKAAANGTTRDLLIAMRDRVALDVENPNTQSRDLAALTRRLMEITKEIEAIDARSAEESLDGESPADEEFDASAV